MFKPNDCVECIDASGIAASCLTKGQIYKIEAVKLKLDIRGRIELPERQMLVLEGFHLQLWNVDRFVHAPRQKFLEELNE